MENIIFLVLGCIMLYLAYAVGIKNNITLFHDYHTVNISEKNIKSFTSVSGVGFLAISISNLASLFLNLYIGDINVYLFIGGMVLGICILLFATIRYNGNLFG